MFTVEAIKQGQVEQFWAKKKQKLAIFMAFLKLWFLWLIRYINHPIFHFTNFSSAQPVAKNLLWTQTGNCGQIQGVRVLDKHGYFSDESPRFSDVHSVRVVVV